MPTDNRLRLDNHQRLQNARCDPINLNRASNIRPKLLNSETAGRRHGHFMLGTADFQQMIEGLLVIGQQDSFA